MISIKKQDVVYDLAKTHLLGDFPDTLPIEKAYLHIGIFMGWVIKNEMYSKFFKEEASTEIYRFNRREIECIILAEIWNGALSHELFNDEANLFTYYYYAGGVFKRDYIEVLVKSLKTIYHVEDTWENFDDISKRISERFTEWKNLTQS